MDRHVRARFIVFRVNLGLALIGLSMVTLLLLLPASNLLQVVNPAPGAQNLPQGVTVGGRDFSGITVAEARKYLTEMAAQFHGAPVAAKEGHRALGVSFVVPDLDGFTLDIDQTLQRLATATAGKAVDPVTRSVAPSKRLADYPEGVIDRGNAAKPVVGLFINVDWGEVELGTMLPTLKRRGVKVTFFVSGRWADKHPALLRQMSADGHEIATHGYDLQYGPTDLERAGKLRDDIARSVLAIEKITAQKVKYYAPHKSEVSAGIVKAAAALDLRTVLYSVDTVDWDPQTSGDLILKRIQKASAGDLILLHPKPNTASVLAQALIELEAKGLHPVTLSELLNPRVDGSSVGIKGQHE